MTSSVSTCCRPTNYNRYNNPYCRNQQSYYSSGCETAYAYSSTATNGLHRLKEILRELDRYSPADIELYRRMEQLNGNSLLYTQDPTGLISLNAAVLSLPLMSGYPARSPCVTDNYSCDAVTPAGRLLDARV